MNLRGNYFKNADDGHDSSFILVLDFNNCSAEKAQQIIDRAIEFANKNLVSGDSYFVSNGTNEGHKFPKKLSVSADNIGVSYTVSGMILPDKRLRKELLEASLSRPFVKADKQALKDYLLDDDSFVCTTNPVDDFSLSFKRLSWDEDGSFECIISVSCYSLGYDYSEITKLYHGFIKEISEKFDLFAAYIDFDGFAMGELLYEYCYNELIEGDEAFECYRTYPWGGYLSGCLLKNNTQVKHELINSAYTEQLNRGMFFSSHSTPEAYTFSKRFDMYNVLRALLRKSYGVIPVEHIIVSGFKPCEEKVYLFNDFSTLYVCFSNGVNLLDILRNEKEKGFEYIGCIDIL